MGAAPVERIPMRRRRRIPEERNLTADSSSCRAFNSRSFESRRVLNSRSFDSNGHDHGTRPAERAADSIPKAQIADSLRDKSALAGPTREKSREYSAADCRLSYLALGH